MESIKKFFTTVTEFDVQLLCLKQCGLFEASSKAGQTLANIFIISTLILHVFVISREVSFATHHISDIIAFSTVLSPIVAQSLTLFILPSIWYYSERIFKMMNQIKMLSKKSLPNDWTNIIAKANRIDQFTMKFLFVNMMTTCTLYNILPAAKDALFYFVYGTEPSCNMPFDAVFYYNIKKSPAYELSYISFTWTIHLSTIVHLAANSIFFGCALNIGAHFDVLRKMIHECDIKEFIEYHKEILNLTKELNEIFKLIIIANHLLLSVLICGLGLQLVTVLNRESFLTIGFAIAAIMEIFIYSYGGQLIMDKSMNVCKEVYNLDKNYLFIIMRSQMEVKIKAGFFHACMPTLTSILNSAWSLMNLFKSFV